MGGFQLDRFAAGLIVAILRGCVRRCDIASICLVLALLLSLSEVQLVCSEQASFFMGIWALLGRRGRESGVRRLVMAVGGLDEAKPVMSSTERAHNIVEIVKQTNAPLLWSWMRST